MCDVTLNHIQLLICKLDLCHVSFNCTIIHPVTFQKIIYKSHCILAQPNLPPLCFLGFCSDLRVPCRFLVGFMLGKNVWRDYFCFGHSDAGSGPGRRGSRCCVTLCPSSSSFPCASCPPPTIPSLGFKSTWWSHSVHSAPQGGLLLSPRWLGRHPHPTGGAAWMSEMCSVLSRCICGWWRWRWVAPCRLHAHASLRPRCLTLCWSLPPPWAFSYSASQLWWSFPALWLR